jgi:peptide/histidine transporter 3/4
VYLTPLLGAFLADAYLGRYWVIISFSCLYFVGMLGVTLVNVIPATKPQMLKPPQSGYNITRGVFWVMMYLVAIVSGLCCVCPSQCRTAAPCHVSLPRWPWLAVTLAWPQGLFGYTSG